MFFRNSLFIIFLWGCFLIQMVIAWTPGPPSMPEKKAAKAFPQPLPPVKVYAYINVPGVKTIMSHIGVDYVPVKVPKKIIANGCNDGTTYLKKVSSKFWGRKEVAPTGLTRPLTIAGSNSLHHLSYFFARRMVERLGRGYSLLLLDAHDDARVVPADDQRAQGVIDCGNWVAWLVQESKLLNRVYYFGQDSRRVFESRSNWFCPSLSQSGRFDVYSYTDKFHYFSNGYNLKSDIAAYKPDIIATALGYKAKWVDFRSVAAGSKTIGRRLDSQYVFLSIDMDVMEPNAVTTAWGNSKMTLKAMKELILNAVTGRILLGVDICGVSKANGALEDGYSLDTLKDLYHFVRKLMDNQ